MNLKLVRKQEILTRHCFKTTKLYKEIAEGVFPPPIHIGDQISAWLEHESDVILRARIAGQSKEEMQALVRSLIADRGKLAEPVEREAA